MQHCFFAFISWNLKFTKILLSVPQSWFSGESVPPRQMSECKSAMFIHFPLAWLCEEGYREHCTLLCYSIFFSTQHPKAPHRIGRHAPETKRRLRTGKCYTFLGLESKKEGDAAIEGVISWLEKHRRSQNKDIWAIYIRSIQQAEIQNTMRFGPFLGEDKTPYLFEWPFINDFSNEELGWECFLGLVVCNRAAEVYVTCE